MNPSFSICNTFAFYFQIFRNMKKNKLLQIKRRFSRIDLFLKKECTGGTRLMRKEI